MITPDPVEQGKIITESTLDASESAKARGNRGLPASHKRVTKSPLDP